MMKVVKIGGNVVDNPAMLEAFCRDFAADFLAYAGMNTPPMTLRPRNPLTRALLAKYQSGNGLRSGVSSA